MILVRLQGGLGNQMFQYAAALRLARRHGVPLKADLSALLDRTPSDKLVFREYDLSLFEPGLPTATPQEIRRFRRLLEPAGRSFLEKVADRFSTRVHFREESLAFDPRVLELPGDTYLEGYFQHARYFADVEALIRERFRLAPDERSLPAATRQLADEIRAASSICIHVRRGDYVTLANVNEVHGVCSMDYFRQGLQRLRAAGADGPAWVFSDDPDWCREHFAGLPGVRVVGSEHAGPRAGTHFWLMGRCHHFLISNSTFGWWAAWLGDRPGKQVIRPARWFQAPGLREVDICPPEWGRLELAQPAEPCP